MVNCKRRRFFYDDKYTDVDVFGDEKSAIEFFKVYCETLYNDLRKDDGSSEEEFRDMVEITEYENRWNIYMEDNYYISLEIQEKDVMSYQTIQGGVCMKRLFASLLVLVGSIALTLLIAESNPKEKDILIDLIMNFLKNNN